MSKQAVRSFILILVVIATGFHTSTVFNSRAARAVMDRKPKTVFQLDTPFSDVPWPQISPIDQETILELVTILLAPIGSHRTLHASPSKGKRSKKRKRQEAKARNSNPGIRNIEKIPAVPELSSHLLVGLSSITRHLEILSRSSRPVSHQLESEASPPGESCKDRANISQHGNVEAALPRHITAVFVCRSSQPSVLHAHFPQLIATASLAHPQLPPTRLVQLPQGCESHLCSSLGLPRASFVAILEDAPHSKALVDFVRDVVPVIEVGWLKEAQSSLYKPVKINAILTTAPVTRKTQKKH